MLSNFFISRPIFAIVLAIFVMVFGLFALKDLPVERYPDIAPPRIVVSASYSGADASTVEQSVTQILEQQIKGLDDLLYFSASSDASGRARISLSFANGTDPDTAQVQVQNAVNRVLSRLPEDVQRQGIEVFKSLGDTHMVIGLYDENAKSSNIELSDYLLTHIENEIARVEGVGEVDVFGSQYAMRIWLDAHKMQQHQLMPSDIQQAVLAQNVQVAAGAIGELPRSDLQYLSAKVTAGTRLRTVDEFKNIILKSDQQGRFVYLKDVARVELGAENYQAFNTMNGYPSAGMAVSLASGANAISTSKAIYETIDRLKKKLPEGYKLVYPNDNTPFIEQSIQEVVKTLFEAILLVTIVMFIFLQNWRATLVPALTVPVVILGTMVVLWLLGLSINTLTLFAMVLAIGLLVDDAIVVVENVERLMHEKGITAKEAAVVSMQEIQGALVGITVVLTAVFIPMAFFGGSTGVIYRQFAITLVSAMVMSLLVALILTPALCAMLLKSQQKQYKWAQRFNAMLESLKLRYLNLCEWSSRHRVVMVGSALGAIVIFAVMYLGLPTSYLPNEDQGRLSIQITLQDNAPIEKTREVGEQVRQYLLDQEAQNIDLVMIRYGRNRSGSGQHLAQGFIKLKHWKERPDASQASEAIRARVNQKFMQHPDARIMIFSPPAVNGLGDTNGISAWLRDIDGVEYSGLKARFDELKTEAASAKYFENLETRAAPDKANMVVHIHQKVALASGLNKTDINHTMSSVLGGRYINDFIDRGKIKRVIMQADAPFRSKPEDLYQWSVRNQAGQMIPFNQFAEIRWSGGPEVLNRFNGYGAIEFDADKQANASSGQAMQELESFVDGLSGVDLAWSGLAFEEQQNSNQTIWLYLISIAFIFLCLAALYESWSIPTVVMTAIPLGVGGNIIFSMLAGFPNDIYFQIALLTIIGLSCKNAILIVEFAAHAQQQGKSAFDAAMEGARLRLRPILMTSIAFGAGVIPLVFASGAGALSRQEIGISVLGGVIFATVLVLVFIPFTYVLVRNMVDKSVKTNSTNPHD